MWSRRVLMIDFHHPYKCSKTMVSNLELLLVWRVANNVRFIGLLCSFSFNTLIHWNPVVLCEPLQINFEFFVCVLFWRCNFYDWYCHSVDAATRKEFLQTSYVNNHQATNCYYSYEFGQLNWCVSAIARVETAHLKALFDAAHLLIPFS